MTDVTEILVANLAHACDQVNSYVAVGLTAAISAFVLDLRSSRTTSAATSAADATDVDTAFGRMPREPAQLLLLGVCFVAGMMAAYAAENATVIASRLRGGTGALLIGAICTRASVATGPVGVRLIAAALPTIFALTVVIRAIRRMPRDPDSRWGLVMMGLTLAAPYGFLGKFLFSLCRE
jgi:hypothetical protein